MNMHMHTGRTMTTSMIITHMIITHMIIMPIIMITGTAPLQVRQRVLR